LLNLHNTIQKTSCEGLNKLKLCNSK